MTILTVGVPAAVALTFVVVTWAWAPAKARDRLLAREQMTETTVGLCVRRVRAGCAGAAAAILAASVLLAVFAQTLGERIDPIGVAVVVGVTGAGICGAALAESTLAIRVARSTTDRRVASLSRREATAAGGAAVLWWPWALVLVSAGFSVAAAREDVVSWWLTSVAVLVTASTTAVATTALVVVTRKPARARDLDEHAVLSAVDHDTVVRLGGYTRSAGVLGVYFAYMLWAEAPGWKMLVLVFASFMALGLALRAIEHRQRIRSRTAV